MANRLSRGTLFSAGPRFISFISCMQSSSLMEKTIDNPCADHSRTKRTTKSGPPVVSLARLNNQVLSNKIILWQEDELSLQGRNPRGG